MANHAYPITLQHQPARFDARPSGKLRRKRAADASSQTHKHTKAVIDRTQVPDCGRQQGGNTSDLIHPEETVADNFALWVTADKAHEPELIDKLAQLMRG